VDLESGEIARPEPVWEIDLAEDELPAPRRRRSGRAAFGSLIAAAAIAGSVVGATTWSERQNGVVPPAFDEGVYRADPGPLQVASVGAPAGDTLPDTSALVDGDPTTTWTAGAVGTGVGETLLFHFDDPVWVDELSFWAPSGGEELRPSRIGVETSDGKVFEVVLADVSGEQAVTLPEPVLVRTVRFEVLGAHPGTGSIGIAGIELRGWPAKGLDREAL
jgi:hypothetical protein